MNRLHNLDYLRGLAASGIMVYHYLSWTLGAYPGQHPMARLGLYGVAIFYVLSGLTLYHVYYNRMEPNKKDLISFTKKRIFRIFPLLWLVIFCSLWLNKRTPDPFDLFLNLSGLFGFIKWEVNYSVGVWSIGNELVFYSFFPVFVLFMKESRWVMTLFSIAIFYVFVNFAFVKIDAEQEYLARWIAYINPLNQLFLFLGGFLIGHLFRRISLNQAVSIALVVSALAIFIFTPAEKDVFSLVTGINRLVFAVACFMLCLGFFKYTGELPALLHKPLTLLGETSYSIYLIHPLVYTATGILFKYSSDNFFHFHEGVRLVTSVLLTLVISYFVYEYFEKFFIRLGAKVGPKSTDERSGSLISRS